MNQFGSEKRMRLALEVDSLEDVAERIETLMRPSTPTGMMEKLKMLPMLAEVGGFFPKTVDAKTRRARRLCCASFEGRLLKFPVLTVVGRRMADGSSRCRAWSRAIRRAGSGMSGCTGCRCMTERLRACTGSGRRSRRNTCGSVLRAEATDAAGAVEMMALTAGGRAAAVEASACRSRC